jgi:hypothetical protein
MIIGEVAATRLAHAAAMTDVGDIDAGESAATAADNDDDDESCFEPATWSALRLSCLRERAGAAFSPEPLASFTSEPAAAAASAGTLMSIGGGC